MNNLKIETLAEEIKDLNKTELIHLLNLVREKLMNLDADLASEVENTDKPDKRFGKRSK